ncbi:hypothetical protein THASP1DRAFT_33676 [Thamnocephalis sphaerospora]|uniref:Protein kinase domain-containing protein n=1 Tax=Thamnocephalis sphaerospora TaxID=78915 RepID=A0A4P9XFZ5_9FUNG|nr:hypothetical protein THASP1DRAFT_33676 [Thamnocephalis sphaerospora]|eukprot:RKP04545.1 hypothetical protein THASP1DRAFT_33676 [Thamnocephalis sphaerospora]
MKLVLAAALLAAAAATLEYDSSAYASPVDTAAPDFAPVTSSDWCSIPGLAIEKEEQQIGHYSYGARVTYGSRNGTIRCHANESHKKQMAHVFEHLSKGKNRPGLASITVDSFPRIERTMMVKGQHCVLTTWPVSVSLKEYVRSMTPARKEKVLPAIVVQIISAFNYLESIGFYYHTIGPESIMIRSNIASEVPSVIVADLHQIRGEYGVLQSDELTTFRQGNELETFENERGYRPPEDYGPSETVTVKKRIPWILGATIYDALTGMPPYGFTKSLDGITPWENGKLEKAMLELQASGNNTYPPVEISNVYLDELVKTLLTCNPQDRPAINKPDWRLVRNLANGSGIIVRLGIGATDMSRMIGLAARTINPFARN